MSALLCQRSYACALMSALYCRALFWRVTSKSPFQSTRPGPKGCTRVHVSRRVIHMHRNVAHYRLVWGRKPAATLVASSSSFKPQAVTIGKAFNQTVTKEWNRNRLQKSLIVGIIGWSADLVYYKPLSRSVFFKSRVLMNKGIERVQDFTGQFIRQIRTINISENFKKLKVKWGSNKIISSNFYRFNYLHNIIIEDQGFLVKKICAGNK